MRIWRWPMAVMVDTDRKFNWMKSDSCLAATNSPVLVCEARCPCTSTFYLPEYWELALITSRGYEWPFRDPFAGLRFTSLYNPTITHAIVYIPSSDCLRIKGRRRRSWPSIKTPNLTLSPVSYRGWHNDEASKFNVNHVCCWYLLWITFNAWWRSLTWHINLRHQHLINGL
jgi:hypothetical protein